MKNNQKQIPCIIIEEHHEAFFLWHYSIFKNWMPKTGNQLIHVDEHADNSVPRFTKSIYSIDSISKLYDFTYEELSIASFLMPTFYQGIFNKLYFIYQPHKGKKQSRRRKLFIRSKNNEGTILVSGKYEKKMVDIPDPGRKEFVVERRAISEDFKISRRSSVLDIDLDYFSCIENPNELIEKRIEITSDEFSNFTNNRYHPLRIAANGGNRIRACQIDSKYYLYFDEYPYIIPSKLKMTEEVIAERMNSFQSFLVNQNVNPSVINICKSEKSGYTPNDQVDFYSEQSDKNVEESIHDLSNSY